MIADIFLSVSKSTTGNTGFGTTVACRKIFPYLLPFSARNDLIALYFAYLERKILPLHLRSGDLRARLPRWLEDHPEFAPTRHALVLDVALSNGSMPGAFRAALQLLRWPSKTSPASAILRGSSSGCTPFSYWIYAFRSTSWFWRYTRRPHPPTSQVTQPSEPKQKSRIRSCQRMRRSGSPVGRPSL